MRRARQLTFACLSTERSLGNWRKGMPVHVDYGEGVTLAGQWHASLFSSTQVPCIHARAMPMSMSMSMSPMLGMFHLHAMHTVHTIPSFSHTHHLRAVHTPASTTQPSGFTLLLDTPGKVRWVTHGRS